MWAYILRRILYNVPVYLGVILLVMVVLRVNDPTYTFLGKNPTYEQYVAKYQQMGLDKPILMDWRFFGRNWETRDGGFGGSHLAKRPGKGRAAVEFAAEVPRGRVTVALTWPVKPMVAEAVPAEVESVGEADVVWVTVLDGETVRRTALVGQTKPPAGIEAEGTVWTPVGEFSIDSGRVSVRINDDASGGAPIADALLVIDEAGVRHVVDSADLRVRVIDDPWTPGGFVRSLGDSQYVHFLKDIVTLEFDEYSWELERPVGDMLRRAIPPSLMISVPSLVMTTAISIFIALVCSFTRGRFLDRSLMVLAVLGMSVSYLVYIIMGQYFGAFWLRQEWGVSIFAIEGYAPELSRLTAWFTDPANQAARWGYYCMLPVLINVVVAMGYDTRFYRAVMVEECNRDYIVTARAKGAPASKIMFVHMLKNAMIPIITRVMITLPFLITGSILVEQFFNIPGMGRTLITAVNSKDFPVIQAFTAVFAAIFIITNILTDVCYALVDPRVRLQ